MSNKYWKTEGSGWDGPYCSLTDERCIHPGWFCSTCSIEVKGFSLEEALRELDEDDCEVNQNA